MAVAGAVVVVVTEARGVVEGVGRSPWAEQFSTSERVIFGRLQFNGTGVVVVRLGLTGVWRTLPPPVAVLLEV